MSVQSGPTFKRYAANGVTTVYAIPFLLLDAADLLITLDGVEVVSGFVLTGVGNPSSTCTFSAAPTGDLLFQLSIPFQRLADYQENGDLLSGTLNNDLDRLWLAIKQLSGGNDRALSTGVLEPEGIPALPVAAVRIQRVLAFDALGDPVASTLTLSELEKQPALALASAAAAEAAAVAAQAAASSAARIAVSPAGGTANALTGAYTPAIAALTNGLFLSLRATLASTAVVPTFTPNSGTIAAKAIVKGNNQPLVAGDISGAGHWLELQYDLTLDKWVLLNPANAVAQQNQIQSIAAAVAANALTLTLNPTQLDFRSPTLGNGVPNKRSINAALNLVVPSGATLGTVSGVASKLVLLAMDNAGTIELAATNLAGGLNLDETTLISTTAISSGATLAGVIYSNTARSNLPFRVVGTFESTQATAGVWAATGIAQGVGGQAFTALGSFGFGQTRQDVTASRALNVVYRNTTGKPIFMHAWSTGAGINGAWQLYINGVLAQQSSQAYAATANVIIYMVILHGETYELRNNGVACPISGWWEIR